MKIEHIAFNVAKPVEMAKWYVKNFGMKIARKMENAPYTHFLKDEGGMMVEIYNNPPEQVPDYGSMHPLLLHLAFTSADPDPDKAKLLAAGATFVEEIRQNDGSYLVMLRDPWGLAIQLCKRGTPLQ